MVGEVPSTSSRKAAHKKGNSRLSFLIVNEIKLNSPPGSKTKELKERKN